ncbi:MAG: hypothetical protein OHK0032_01520 [Thermodesulfovibrionales bacterium]
MTPLLIFLVFLILLLTPFVPVIIELLRPKDASPLFINMDYSKDPRYFGRSFKKILKNAIPADASSGIREVMLSRNEKVEIAHSMRIPVGDEVNHILYIIGDLVSEDKARFNKEVYVKGDAAIGSKNTMRAIACEGQLYLSSNVSIVRWADAEGKVEVYDGCNLGISISSGDELRLSKGCRFKRLYGMPVTTYSANDNDHGHCPNKEGISDNTWIVDKDRLIIPPLTKVEKDIIVKKDLKIRSGSLILGNIKTYRELIIEEDVKISGNLFSDGDIEIGEGTTISGDIFSQGVITIKKKVGIGSAGKIKSVIGKKGIILGQDVVIYGYAMTEGSGMVV